MRTITGILAVLVWAAVVTIAPAGVISTLPDKVPPVVPDRQDFQVPDRVRLTGWVGARIDVNESNRLVKLDAARLLEGYRKRPGRQSWDGEHVGKWLHAASLAWANTGDPALREKLDHVAAELVKCQLADGYLGTYLDKDRWTQWDVWAHKYNLIGLITYMRYTGNVEPMPACRRMADLLCKTFGDAPGQLDIIKAGQHKGMAPTSVLEPMVLLYRLTGEPRYLDFCKYILRAWDHPKGPKIISTLLKAKRVDKVGNAKAYEMLSCLNGVLEFYRTTGDPKMLEACLNAWRDIVKNRLYLTGAASYGEFFRDDFDLPNVSNVGETCVTVTWLQFNAQLLRLTGEARFADQLERVVLNQLFGAQRCDGSAWGYYVQMEGKKPYSGTLDGHCCLSSGPRGVALIPTFATSTDADGVVVNFYDAGTARLNLRDGMAVTLTTVTRYPGEEGIAITVDPAEKKLFAVKLRIPSWCSSASVQVNGKTVKPQHGRDGYAAISRKWDRGDRIELQLKLEPRVVVGDHKNQGKVAVLYGPLVLAADAALLGDQDGRLAAVSAAGNSLDKLGVAPEPAPELVRSWAGARVFRVNAIARKPAGNLQAGAPFQVRLIPFADAGGTGSSYKVWLPLGLASTNGNVLLDGNESRSRMGNIGDSIIDGNPRSFVVTLSEKLPAEDWFAVTLDEPAAITRVVFVHGSTFHNGGWFDTSAAKPRVQVKTALDGKWEDAGELKDYPATTSQNPAGLKGGERFSCRLASPMNAIAVRVAGKPASGDNPRVAFSSCAELEAFADKP
ncbi:MAG: beta-L-arabinofuranosidase domain-containing protein [Verrucomicrobiota bacterium]